jgi:hypothetical protein
MDDELRSKWPSIEHAYGLVLPSYQWMLSRFEAADSRIQTLQTFIVSVTFGLVAVLKTISDDLQFNSLFFITAMGFALIALAVGAVGRSLGAPMLADPTVFYERWLHKSESEFKKDLLYFAGEHFTKNRSAILKKSRISLLMTLLFLVELGVLLFWIAHE